MPKEETPEEKAPGAAAQRTKKIFVGGLAPSVDEAQLRQHFSQFGTVEDAVVMYDHENKRPRGFGFVTFAEEEAVERVFTHGNVQTIADKPIEVKAAVPRDQMPPAPRMHGSYYGPPPQQRGGPGYGGPGPHRPYGGAPPYGPGPGYPPPYGAYGRPPFNGRPPATSYGAYGPRSPGSGPGPRQPALPNPLAQAPYGGYPPSQPQQRFAPPAQAPSAQTGSPSSAGAAGAKVPQMPNAYDVYNGVNNAAMLSSLYNIAGLQLPNGLPAGAAAAAVNSKQLNTLNHQLKALNLAANFASFANQPDPTFSDDAAAYAAATQDDFAASAAEAIQGLNGLAVNPADFNSLHDAGFTTAPAPGWSS